MLLLLGTLAALCFLTLTILFPRAAACLWILLLETSPGSWLGRLAGVQHHEAIIALLKAYGLLLAAALALRFGARRDRTNPAFAFTAMFGAGLIHGLYPGLSLLASLRSLIGSAAPFLFSFTRLPENFCATIIRTLIWAPLFSVLAGLALAACGLSPLYVVEQGVLRLGGAGEPAFLAGFALTALYASALQTSLTPSREATAGILINLALILLSGARAPLAIALAVLLVLLILQRRLLLLAAAGALAFLALIFAGALRFLRVIGLTQLGEATDLSHRTLVWPYFERAFLSSPWFGWGVGAGKIIIPIHSPLGALLGTNAAHNEYLRIGAEGGLFGLALLLLLIILWVRRGSAALPPAPRLLMRVIFIGLAVHSATDNTMIATTSSTFFLWVSCIFATAANRSTATA